MNSMKKNTMTNTKRKIGTFDQKQAVTQEEEKKNQTMMNSWSIQKTKMKVTLKRRVKQKGIIFIKNHNMKMNMMKSSLLMKIIEVKKFRSS